MSGNRKIPPKEKIRAGKLDKREIYFEQDIAAELDQIAAQEGTSVSKLVSGMVNLWLEEGA